jgi:hypothetical protein
MRRDNVVMTEGSSYLEGEMWTARVRGGRARMVARGAEPVWHRR